MYVELDILHQITEQRRDHRNPYGRWESSHRFQVGSYGLITEERTYKSEPLPEGVGYGDTVYAIIANWSSGDSFGRAYRGYVEVLGIFKSRELAQKAYDLLEAPPSDSYDFDSYTATYTLDNGNEVKVYRPWYGYFDELEELVLREFTLTDDPYDLEYNW